MKWRSGAYLPLQKFVFAHKITHNIRHEKGEKNTFACHRNLMNYLVERDPITDYYMDTKL